MIHNYLYFYKILYNLLILRRWVLICILENVYYHSFSFSVFITVSSCLYKYLFIMYFLFLIFQMKSSSVYCMRNYVVWYLTAIVSSARRMSRSRLNLQEKKNATVACVANRNFLSTSSSIYFYTAEVILKFWYPKHLIRHLDANVQPITKHRLWMNDHLIINKRQKINSYV